MAVAPKVIAEIGCNHKGEMEIAKEMIKTAAVFCKVDAVKFQKRNPKELLSEVEYNSPHPNPIHAYGKTYGEHREYLEFNLDQHQILQRWCEQEGVEYSTSVWDLTSAKEISSLKPRFLKIPSACNLNFEMLGWLCENFKGKIHLSLGMTTKGEEDLIVNFFKDKRRNSDLVLYSCTSGYPVQFDDICLEEITRLKEKFGSSVGGIAFSGHHLGIAADVAAFVLGAEFVERHFTLDRTWRGTDHAASLEPEGLRKLTRDLRSVAKALTLKKSDILDVENVQRAKLKQGNIKIQ